MALRVLVVDDAILFRRVVSEALGQLPGVELIGTAGNGKSALAKIQELKPDLVTLDIEMPEMDGLEVLDALKIQNADCGVIVVSALTVQGGRMTLRALDKGAFDFITKPSSGTVEENRLAIREALAPRISAYTRRREIQTMLRTSGVRTSPQSWENTSKSENQKPRAHGKPDMVLMGISTGGPSALGQMLPKLPADLGVPVFVVQHMPAQFTRPFAESLDAKCGLRIQEAQHLEVAQPGTVYIAPGGKQMKLLPGRPGEKLIHITEDPPENNCRPSVDVLFRSVAHHFPGQAMAVIMTGMGSDGTLGLRLLKRHGCTVLAQDEATSVVYGMPKAAVEAGVVDGIFPLEQLASRIVMTLRGFPP